MTYTLRELDTDLWVAEAPLKTLGLQIGTRMTVVRLANHELWIHSPIQISGALKESIDALGLVQYIVAPNAFHHLYLADASAAWPEAQVWGAQALKKKRKDVRFDGLFREGDELPWSDEIEDCYLAGAILDETVFFHRKSRTLISSDLAVNQMQADDWLTKLYLKASRVEGKFGHSLLIKVCFRDKAKSRASIDRLMEWNFDRVILAHGEVLESGGREAVERSFKWLPATKK
ncbi:MAG: DUF4336 domain-containing protein [Gammaproteobacteria bacterium]